MNDRTEHHVTTDSDLSEVRSPRRRPSWIIPAAIGAASVMALSAGAILALSGDDSTPDPAATQAIGPATNDDPTDTRTITSTVTPAAPSTVTATIDPLPSPELAPPSPGSGCATYTETSALPLEVCDTGSAVRVVQDALVTAGHDLDVDGYFGSATAASVRDFQVTTGLAVDGVVGPNTWDALCSFSTDAACAAAPTDTVSSADPAGITIGGVAQRILHDCVHYPFQSRDGGGDAHVSGEQFLVEDPDTGIRRVVAVWIEDDVRSLVVSDLSEGTVAQTGLEFGGSVAETMTLRGEQVRVTVDQTTSGECDTMFLESSTGAFVAYSVIDVCNQNGVTVLTLNSFWGDDWNHAFSEMNYRLDDGLSTAQMRLSGDDVAVTSAQRDLAAWAEFVSGSFTDESGDWTFHVEIDQYPQGGHECVWGQIVD